MITPMVLAHRGWSSRAPENSLEAMKLASVSGADGVELDIHETLDGGFVVHHDPDVPHGLITALPLSFIIGHAGKHGAPVSSLTEVLGTLAERLPGATVFIEVKAMRSWSRLRSLLRPYRNDLDLEIQSFDTWILKDVAKSADGFPLGWITKDPGDDPVAQMQELGARTLSLHHDKITPHIVETIHNQGGRLSAWTVNDPTQARELAQLGVDVIIGDDPGMLHSSMIDMITA